MYTQEKDPDVPGLWFTLRLEAAVMDAYLGVSWGESLMRLHPPTGRELKEWTLKRKDKGHRKRRRRSMLEQEAVQGSKQKTWWFMQERELGERRNGQTFLEFPISNTKKNVTAKGKERGRCWSRKSFKDQTGSLRIFIERPDKRGRE